MITSSEVVCRREMVQLLQPFKKLTKEISAQNYVTNLENMKTVEPNGTFLSSSITSIKADASEMWNGIKGLFPWLYK